MAWTPYYNAEGKRVPSVTTIISNCKLGSIEGLLIWANRCGLDGKSHREEANKAADIGSIVHDKIDAHIKEKEFDASQYDYEQLDASEPCFNAFLKWKEQTKFKLVESEVRLVSEKHGFAGTLDAVIEVDNTLMLCDWKTSNGVFVDYLIQLAAYQKLWEENFPEKPLIKDAYLLRISKQKEPDDPVVFTAHYWSDLSLAWEAFEHMLELYRLNKRLKGLC